MNYERWDFDDLDFHEFILHLYRYSFTQINEKIYHIISGCFYVS